MGGDQQRGAETLDLQRTRQLARQAVPHAMRGQRHERCEDDRDHGEEQAEAEQRLTPSLPTPHIGHGERNEHGRIELGRDRQPECSAAEP